MKPSSGFSAILMRMISLGTTSLIGWSVVVAVIGFVAKLDQASQL
jgi:hypothetical protein